MDESKDGIYAVYATSKASNGLIFLVMKRGVLTGIDFSKACIDGNYSTNEADNAIDGHLKVRVPPNTTLIQGKKVGAEGLVYEISFRLPANFASEPFCRIDTPFGPLNLRFEKLRDLGNI